MMTIILQGMFYTRNLDTICNGNLCDNINRTYGNGICASCVCKMTQFPTISDIVILL